MVALLHPTRPHISAAPRAAARPAATHLRLVVDNTAPRAVSPAAVLGIAAVIAMVLLVVMVRGVQGAPPAATWAELSDTAAVPAATGVTVTTGLTVTVGPSDTWASIAARVDPSADPVEFARRAASANGGYVLVEGQVLTLPATN